MRIAIAPRPDVLTVQEKSTCLLRKASRSPLTPWTEKLLYRFSGGSDGGISFTSLIFDHAGNIYGTTTCGGANGSARCSSFRLPAGALYESVLYSFASGSDGI
jgi:hypothetical protein